MKANPELVKFIREARKRGYEDFQIRVPLLEKGWPSAEIKSAFDFLKPKKVSKNRIEVYLDGVLLRKLETRAKKNMLNLHEQIEDILRRSVLSMKRTSAEEKVDDKFITFFSRKKR